MSNDKGNSGISMGGGSFSAVNVAVGDNATINIGGDVNAEVNVEIAALKSAIAEADVEPPVKAEAEAAVAALETEAQKETPDKPAVSAALDTLERISKIGGGLVTLGEKIAPHVAKLALLLL